MRLIVVSPFLDRQHGTELCIIEQIERFARSFHWTVELYSQKVSHVSGICPASQAATNSPPSIVWHKISDIPGPHLLKYLWWFSANQWRRRCDRRSGAVRPDLVYSPGINCFDADVIVVHIVFHAFYDQVRSALVLSRASLSTWPRLIHRKLYYKLIMMLERRIYRDQRPRLIAVSNHVAVQLKAYFQRDDVTVIPNAVDTRRFSPAARIPKREDSRRTFGYSKDEFVLLLIGNDLKKKGLDTLLRALSSLKHLPIRSLVVGSDDVSMYRTLLDELGLRDRVRFEKPAVDVLPFYSAADAYVGPSLEDAFNLPILEAMACGLPVIASANAGASELVRDGETGFLLTDPLNDAYLAGLIGRLFADRTLCRDIGQSAAQQVQESSNWDENAKKTRQFLEETLLRAEA